MGTSRTEPAGAGWGPGDRTDRASGSRLRRWLRVAGRGADRSASAELMDELERELALLREENACLKVSRERAADRPLNERMRHALAPRHEPDPAGDEPWQVLTECMLLRDGLLDACRELERGARELRERLEAIPPSGEAASRDPRLSDDLEGVA
jgi:hypothetical protein